ncbi:MAG: phosphoribosylformylglycinamidine cyclo-ligase [Candidatus Pacebacteria bacterium]|nr:phosphoribosylformylglycinamidine cyclo-ligase [Candidatus Paceibacterota bacterium]
MAEDAYAASGVNIDAGNEVVRHIKEMVKGTHNKNVLEGIGSFGSLFDISDIAKEYKNPVLVQSVDSVGTKVSVAKLAKNFKGIGADMVNHSANDIVCMGAKGLTFLDYVAHEKLDIGTMDDIMQGMTDACKASGLALVGGETAELPGVYAKDEHDIAGAITGVVEKEKIITGEKISAGDAIIGLSSSGLHTNGYSLARKAFFETAGLTVSDTYEGLGETIGEALLKVHLNYAPAVLRLIDSGVQINGIAHLTGGGFIENIPRVLPKNVNAQVKKGSWPVLPVFQAIIKIANVPETDQYRSFNMGIGMVLMVPQTEKARVMEMLSGEKEFKAYEIGEIVGGEGKTTLV